MNKIQFIKLLALRGIEELKKGQSIADAMKLSGGEPSKSEMVVTNELAMNYYIDELVKLEDKYNELESENKTLNTKVESMFEDVSMLNALEAVGVDNWKGYGEAQEILKEQNEL